MRFSTIVALFGAVASVSAATLSARQAGLPTCAAACLAGAPMGDCASDDNACMCNNTEFVTAATGCITSTCTGEDLATALQAATALCAAEGVTLPGAEDPAAGGEDAPADTASDSASSSSASTPAASTPAASTPAASSTAPPAASSAPPAGNGAMTKGVSAAAGIAAIALAAVAL